MSLPQDTSMLIPSGPTSVFIELTSFCNNRCPGCGNVFADPHSSHTKVPAPLKTEQWKTVLLKLQPYVTNLRFTGGEPTLYPGLQEVLNFSTELGIPFVLFTNGRWPKPEKLLYFLKQNRQFNGMLISVHGSEADDHEAFNGVKGSYEETVANIRLAARSGVKFNTNMVVTKYNYHKIERIYKFVRELGASRMVVARYLGIAMPEIEANSEQLRHAVETVEEMRRKGARLGYSGCIPRCFASSGAVGCTAAYTFMSVDPWGNVRPCNHSPVTMGNLLAQDVASIWYSDEMARWRISVPFECQTCSAYALCHGGCHATAMAYGQLADPLMQKGEMECKSQTIERRRLAFGKYDRPVAKCQVRPEAFGYLLMHNTHSLPVTGAAMPILEACDGSASLDDIRYRFGQEGLDFVGALIERGYIYLQSVGKRLDHF